MADTHPIATAPPPLPRVSWRVRTALRRAGLAMLRVTASAGLVCYCGWWVLWLGRGKLPPSPFLALTGLPAPTTGFTRSLLSLLRGDWHACLRWNPFSIPICVLLALSLACLGWRLLRRRPLRLGRHFLYLWAGLLLAAWAAKLLGGPAWW